jgi:hypothetical protein
MGLSSWVLAIGWLKARRGQRTGAVLSLELVLVMPVLALAFFSVVEFSLLLMGRQRVQSAATAACRVGTLPASDAAAQQQAMRDAAARALGGAMADAYQMQSDLGPHAGDPVVVRITVPMTAASPNMLAMLGFSLEGRQLAAQTQMCRQ